MENAGGGKIIAAARFIYFQTVRSFPSGITGFCF
jgi:hypothetical protein